MKPYQMRFNAIPAIAAIIILVFAAAPANAFRLAVAEFTVTGHASPEAIGRIIADSAVSKLSAVPDLELLDRGGLDTVFAEQELSLSGLIDSATAVSVGQILGSAAVLTGECIIVGEEVLFSAMIIDSETGMVLIARSSVFSGPLLSGIDRETDMLASEIVIDADDSLTGRPAALWVSRATIPTDLPADGLDSWSSSSRILIYALLDIDDLIDDYGQWYPGPEHLAPLTTALADRSYDAVVHDRRTLPDLTNAELTDYSQVWIFDADGNGRVDPLPRETQLLHNYFMNGGGVWLCGENTVSQSTSNWKKDINAYAEPFGFSIDRNVVIYSVTMPVPATGHPLLAGVDAILFDGETGSISINKDNIKLLVPIEEQARFLQPSLTYEDLYQWADSERIRQVYESDSAYTFGWLLGRNFKKAGPRVPPGVPGVVIKDEGNEGRGRLIGDAGWMLGWAFTDYSWEEYKNADNMAFLLNAAGWLGE